MHVLVVESDVGTRDLVVAVLHGRGHTVTLTTDRDIAWQTLQDGLAPLVLLNGACPLVDGAELCRRVRAAPGGDTPYILALLPPGLAACAQHLLDAGADDFLTDPRHVAMLRARLAIAERNVALLNERLRAESALEHRALHDALTDLPNRALLLERAQQTIVAARRHGSCLGLLVLDLDRFKEVNDTLGHHAGDLLLQETSARLLQTLRESDTVARLGGDEFAVLLPDADAAGASLTALKIQQALNEPFQIHDQMVTLGVSIGGVLYPDHGEDAELLLQHADVAMYDAKRSGGGYAAYDQGRDNHTPDRLALLSELRRAIEREEFLLHYLPKVSLRSGRPVGLEALVRWEHPERGLLLPGEFIPLAEESGLIGPLCRWVLNAALRQAQVWRCMGVRLPIEVNLSMRNLNDPQFPDAVAEILSAWGAAPGALRLEINERALGEPLERATHAFGRLHTLGVGVGVDDFGGGVASTASLERMAMDELKIDRSFVQAMLHNEDDAAIVRGAIALGHRLGVPVVAEGVDDAETRDLLLSWGCDLAQGYYLARPMTAVELLGWLKRRAQKGAEPLLALPLAGEQPAA